MPRDYGHLRCSKCNTARSTPAGLAAHQEQCSVCRCPECRTRFSTVKALLDHIKATNHKSCDCGHGHHFPHRPGTTGCQHEPWDDLLNQPRGVAVRNAEPPF